MIRGLSSGEEEEEGEKARQCERRRMISSAATTPCHDQQHGHVDADQHSRHQMATVSHHSQYHSYATGTNGQGEGFMHPAYIKGFGYQYQQPWQQHQQYGHYQQWQQQRPRYLPNGPHQHSTNHDWPPPPPPPPYQAWDPPARAYFAERRAFLDCPTEKERQRPFLSNVGHERDTPLPWQPHSRVVDDGGKQTPFSDITTTDRDEERLLLQEREATSRSLCHGSRNREEVASSSSRTLDVPSSVSVADSAAKAAAAARRRKERKWKKHVLNRKKKQQRRRAEMLRWRRQRQRSTSSSSSSSSSTTSEESGDDDDEVGRARWEKSKKERPAKAEATVGGRKSQCESIGDCYNRKRIRNEGEEEQSYFLGGGNDGTREQERSLSPQEKVLFSSSSAIVSQSRLSSSTALKSAKEGEGNISQSLPGGPYSEVQQKQLVKRSSYYYDYYNSGDATSAAAAEEGFVPAHPTSQQLEHLNSRRRAYGGDDRGKRGSSPLIPKSDQQHQSFKAAGIEREEEEGRNKARQGEKWDHHQDDAHCKQLERERVSISSSLLGSRRGIMETYVAQQQQNIPQQQQQVIMMQDSNGFIQNQHQTCIAPQQTIIQTDHYQQQQPQTAVPYFQQQQQQHYMAQQHNNQSPMYLNPFSGVSPGQSSVDSGYVYGADSSPYIGLNGPMSVATSVAEPASVMSNSNTPADDDAGFVGSPAIMNTPSHVREEEEDDNNSNRIGLERTLDHQASQDNGIADEDHGNGEAIRTLHSHEDVPNPKRKNTCIVEPRVVVKIPLRQGGGAIENEDNDLEPLKSRKRRKNGRREERSKKKRRKDCCGEGGNVCSGDIHSQFPTSSVEEEEAGSGPGSKRSLGFIQAEGDVGIDRRDSWGEEEGNDGVEDEEEDRKRRRKRRKSKRRRREKLRQREVEEEKGDCNNGQETFLDSSFLPSRSPHPAGGCFQEGQKVELMAKEGEQESPRTNRERTESLQDTYSNSPSLYRRADDFNVEHRLQDSLNVSHQTFASDETNRAASNLALSLSECEKMRPCAAKKLERLRILEEAERLGVEAKPPPEKRSRGRVPYFQRLQEAMWFKRAEEEIRKEEGESSNDATDTQHANGKENERKVVEIQRTPSEDHAASAKWSEAMEEEEEEEEEEEASIREQTTEKEVQEAKEICTLSTPPPPPNEEEVQTTFSSTKEDSINNKTAGNIINDDFDDIFAPINGLDDEVAGDRNFTAADLFEDANNAAKSSQQQQCSSSSVTTTTSMPLLDESQYMANLESFLSMHVDKHQQQVLNHDNGANNVPSSAAVPPSQVIMPRQVEEDSLGFTAASPYSSVSTSCSVLPATATTTNTPTSSPFPPSGNNSHPTAPNGNSDTITTSARGPSYSAPNSTSGKSPSSIKSDLKALRAAAKYRGVQQKTKNTNAKTATTEKSLQANLTDSSDSNNEEGQSRRRLMAPSRKIIKGSDVEVAIVHEDLIGEEWLVCKITGCSFWTRKPERMDRHMSCHESATSKFFVCPDCGKRFHSLPKMLKHDRFYHTPHIKDYECRLCGAEVTDISVHLKVHRDETPHSCQVCNSSFRHRNSLVRHMNRHAGQHPYLCQHCKRKFTSVNRLNEHLRTEHFGDDAKARQEEENRHNMRQQKQQQEEVHQALPKKPVGRPRKNQQSENITTSVPQFSITVPAPQATATTAATPFPAFAATGSSAPTILVQTLALDPTTGQSTPILSAIPQQFLPIIQQQQATTIQQQPDMQSQQQQQAFFLQQQPQIVNLPIATPSSQQQTITAPEIVSLDDIPIVIQESNNNKDVMAIAMQEIVNEESTLLREKGHQSKATSLEEQEEEVAILTPPPSTDTPAIVEEADEGGVEEGDLLLKAQKDSTIEKEEKEGFKEDAIITKVKEVTEESSENRRSNAEKKDESIAMPTGKPESPPVLTPSPNKNTTTETRKFRCDKCGKEIKFERFFKNHVEKWCKFNNK